MENVEEPIFSIADFATQSATDQTPAHVIVTRVATSQKLVVLGYSDGSLSLYDVFGNRLDHHPNLHVGPVSAVALGGGPSADQVVVSAGHARGDIRAARLNTDAGRPSDISGSATTLLSAATVCVTKQVDSGITALAVDPHFGRPHHGDRIAYAETTGRVVLYTAGWFGGTEVLIQEPSDVSVYDLQWVHHLLAFATVDGVRVHDTRANRPVCIVAPPGASTPPSPMANRHSGDSRWPRSSDDLDAELGPPAQQQQARSLTTVPLDANKENGMVMKETNGLHAQSMSTLRKDGATDLISSPSSSEASSVMRGRQRKLKRWALTTKIYMTPEFKDPSTPKLDTATILMYVTYPSGARVVRIGPQKKVKVEDGTEKQHRDIELVFKLNQETLAKEEAYSVEIHGIENSMGASVDDSPLISVVPFGRKERVALLGTPSRGLIMHLISEEGESIRSMRMPHQDLTDADLLHVPGGDPLILIVGHSGAARKSKEETTRAKQLNKDVMYVRSLSTAERVKWLLGQRRFSDALRIAQSAPGGSLRRAEVSLEEIGEQFLDSLYDADDFNTLSVTLPEIISTTTPNVGFRSRDRVMAKRKKRWERWIGAFRKSSRLEILAPTIPTYEPCLDEATYNSILLELSRTHPTVMLEVLKTWPADVYGVSAVTKAIENELGELEAGNGADESNAKALREGLYMMYGLSGRHDETLNLLMREESSKVYDYIRSHQLYEAVRSTETIKGLFKIDQEAATDLLVHAPETVLPPDAVIPILTKVNNSKWTFMYLHTIFTMDPDQAPKYHNQLIKLYVDHGAPGMLFRFLQTSTHYSLDRAMQEMGGPKGFKSGHLARERVHVLSAMGDLNSAMDILLNELGDTFEAINFASDHGDTVLWERLVEHAREHADTLAALLDSPAGGKVDPLQLVPLLNAEMKIPYLRDRLHRILVDAVLERALREDAAAALHHDANKLLKELDDCVSLLPK